MSNKIININSSTDSSTKIKTVKDNYTYRDICMVSKPRSINIVFSELDLYAKTKAEEINKNASRNIYLNTNIKIDAEYIYNLFITYSAAEIIELLDIDNNNEKIKIEELSSNILLRVLRARANYLINDFHDLNSIFNGLYQCFTWIPGERILLPEFGSKLRLLLYEGITDYNIEQIMSEIRHCVSEWEPRVQIEKVVNISNTNETEDNTVHLEILFTVPSLSNKEYSIPLEYNISQNITS